ncbi:nucleotidyltransferase family protein [Aurantiacibacter luteus]|uniref:MobA-like NTP transferase domain-containing protein n=1 Tax=Aurantiacibacter luteus TaxID=1581420 RepID=A0A0G9MXJ9_9SPHN|nr:nucleotidyltransferase family protein [Aurantiacibacter luteus]KLE35425.1 hypothetical protein AAW00_03040 [Aurantiacibacter luteus]
MVDALVLAGSRPGPDPIRDAYGVPTKALIPVGGTPMLARVLTSLRAAPEIARLIVVSQDPALLEPLVAEVDAAEQRLSRASIAATLREILHDHPAPLLVTTADNVLLDEAILTEFLAAASDVDVAVGVVEQRTFVAAGHSGKRTWLPFRGGRYSGANLFMLGGPQVLPLVEAWARVEQARKKSRAVLSLFGLPLLLGALLRVMTLQGFARRAAARFGLIARVVVLSQGHACIDADTPQDIAAIEALLARLMP